MTSSTEITILCYCRAGFEADCAQEIGDVLGQKIVSQFTADSSFLICTLKGASQTEIASVLSTKKLCFARQVIFLSHAAAIPLAENDRVGPLLPFLDPVSEKLFSQVLIESPDTNDGKKLQKFCHKFERPFANGLKRLGYKQVFSRKDCPQVHVFFPNYEQAFVGLSFPPHASPHENGIIRLKFPAAAPSRSTLKLEEAFFQFLSEEERTSLLAPGMTAVDLGAAPGGWTYQFVRRDINVTAVDNGAMDVELMASGLVTHLKADAFKYRPPQAVDWLVCDMVEQPARVAQLVQLWLREGLCRFAIVNLKLPMKKRWECIKQCQEILAPNSRTFLMKQLYHDREEITIFVRNIV